VKETPTRARSLGTLADPGQFTDPLNISGEDREQLLQYLKQMLVIRRVEEKIGDMVLAGKIVGPCHLGIGQEAIAVGISGPLRTSDRVFGAHRSHSHYLALGAGVYPLLAEVLGKLDGCSRGMGGSMHLIGREHGFCGSVPIVAGTVALAVGAALAARKDRSGDVAVVYFGDGASEEGIVHESLNLAAAWKLPILFVCENNLFSSHLHIRLRQPSDAVARFADAHCIPAQTVDGNDVVAVARAAKRFVSAMRAGGGPGFMEVVTYRWRGHVGPSEDNDVGVNRGNDLVFWKKRDPVARLCAALKGASAIVDTTIDAMDRGIRAEVDSAWLRAESAAYPPAASLLGSVYAAAQ